MQSPSKRQAVESGQSLNVLGKANVSKGRGKNPRDDGYSTG